jgi:hypothetical protein
MFAVEWLIQEGHYERTVDTTSNGNLVPVEHLSAKMLVTLSKDYTKLGKVRAEAIRQSIQRFRGYANRLHIYDRSPSGGSLSDTGSIRLAVKRSMVLQGKTDMVIVDNLRSVMTQGFSDLEKQQEVSPALEHLTRSEETITLLLTHPKIGNADGAKGTLHSEIAGGDRAAGASDEVWLSGYRWGKNADRLPDDKLVLGVHTSRLGKGQQYMMVNIHAPSGLILNGGKGVEYKLASNE